MQPIQNDSFKAYKPQPQQPDPFPFVELEDHQQEKLRGGYLGNWKLLKIIQQQEKLMELERNQQEKLRGGYPGNWVFENREVYIERGKKSSWS